MYKNISLKKFDESKNINGKCVIGSIFKKIDRNIYVALKNKYNWEKNKNRIQIGGGYNISENILFKGIVIFRMC